MYVSIKIIVYFCILDIQGFFVQMIITPLNEERVYVKFTVYSYYTNMDRGDSASFWVALMFLKSETRSNWGCFVHPNDFSKESITNIYEWICELKLLFSDEDFFNKLFDTPLENEKQWH